MAFGVYSPPERPRCAIPPSASQRWYLMRPEPRISALLKLIVVAMTLMVGSGAWAAKYKVLYAFKGGNDGNYPSGSLVLDTAGNLYGTTVEGGAGQQNCSGPEP